MDPNAAVRRINAAARAGETEDFEEAVGDLVDWLASGGFPPTTSINVRVVDDKLGDPWTLSAKMVNKLIAAKRKKAARNPCGGSKKKSRRNTGLYLSGDYGRGAAVARPIKKPNRNFLFGDSSAQKKAYSAMATALDHYSHGNAAKAQKAAKNALVAAEKSGDKATMKDAIEVAKKVSR